MSGSPSPLVSIIIPTYNRKPYLKEALESVFNQTHRNLEVIIVDDASTDGTAELVEELIADEPRARLIRKDRNQGACHSRNLGLDAATGTYIKFFDSDDVLLPQAIERQLAHFAENPNADLVACQTTIIEEDKVVDIDRPWGELAGDPRLRFLGHYVNWITGASLLSVQKLREVGTRWDEDLKVNQDYDFHLFVLLHGMKAAMVDETLFLLRRTSGEHISSIWDSRRYHALYQIAQKAERLLGSEITSEDRRALARPYLECIRAAVRYRDLGLYRQARRAFYAVAPADLRGAARAVTFMTLTMRRVRHMNPRLQRRFGLTL